MKVAKQKSEKARELRFAGKTISETAKLTGLSRNTITKLERGWVDSKGVLHGGWSSDLTVERLRDTASRVKKAEAFLNREECARVTAGLAQEFLGKIVEFLPNLTLKTSRDAKFLASEVRELLKLMEYYRGAKDTETPADGLYTTITLEDLQAHYERTRDIVPGQIEPAEEPDELPEEPDELPAVPESRGRVRHKPEEDQDDDDGDYEDDEEDDE